MAQTVCVIVRKSDSERLEAIASDRSRPQKHAERARVVFCIGGWSNTLSAANNVGQGMPRTPSAWTFHFTPTSGRPAGRLAAFSRSTRPAA
jgi:hypothetical protein